MPPFCVTRANCLSPDPIFNSYSLSAQCLNSRSESRHDHCNSGNKQTNNARQSSKKNIARVFNLNYLVNQIEFVFILDNSCFRLNCLGPLCHHLNWLQIWPPDGATCIDYKSISCNFGHKVVPPGRRPASVENLATMWHHMHSFKIWSSGGSTCIVSKVGHQVATASHALSHCLGLPYWQYQLVLSWYLHQPESTFQSFTKVCE